MVYGGELFDRVLTQKHYKEKEASKCIYHILKGL